MKALKVIVPVVILAAAAAFFAVPELRALLGPGEMSYQDASAEIAAMVEDIRPAEAWVKHRKQLPGLQKGAHGNRRSPSSRWLSGLPVMRPLPRSSSPARNPDKMRTDGCRLPAFNRSGATTSGGKRSQVAIRKIASGTDYQFIAASKRVPDGFSPSTTSGSRWPGHIACRRRSLAKVAGKRGRYRHESEVAKRLRERYQTRYSQPARRRGARRTGHGLQNPFLHSTGLNFLVRCCRSLRRAMQAS